MSLSGGRTGGVSLRDAAATVQRDSQWWLLCLGYGFAAATGIGLPLAAGFVMESLDNSRRGYPTPLPPVSDPVSRSLTGFFALLIDFAFFVLPILAGGMLMLCVSIALVLAGGAGQTAVGPVIGVLAAIAGSVVAGLWLCGAAPVGRLIFAREGRIEDAISSQPLRLATGNHGRSVFLRARLASLPIYLPAVLFGAATVAVARMTFTGQAAAVGLGLCLTMAALVYAHLVVVQLYVAAEKEVQRRELGM